MGDNRTRCFLSVVYQTAPLQKARMLFLLSLMVAISIQLSNAQEIGFRPVVAPEPVELGFVENASGDLHLEIPLGSFPQRGTRVPTAYRYTYDSGIWTVNPIQNVWMVNPLFATSQGGWQLASTSALKVYFSTLSSNCTTYFDFLWLDASGTQHEFPITTSTCSPNTPNGDAFAADSSGYHMYVTNYSNAKVFAPDGTLVCESPAVTDSNNHYIDAEDANGNFYTQTYGDQVPPGFFDTTGRQALQSYASAPGALNSQGSYSQYGVTYATIPVKTAFGQSGVTEYSGSITVIQSIALPTGESYTFKYDCDSGTGNAACGSPSGQSGYYGLLTSLTLPTGGTISYGYVTFSDSYGSKSRWLNSRTSANGSWTYTPQVISTCSSTQVGCREKVTVAKPSGASVVYTFTMNNGAWPTQIQTSDSSGNLSTVANTFDFSVSCPFNYSFSPCYGAGFVRLLTTQTTVPTPSGNIAKQLTYAYDSPQQGNITVAKEWRYYSGSFPSTPDRETDTTYLSTGTNDIDKPLSVTIKNSSSSMVAKTLYTYDSYSGSCPGGGLATVSGATNHDDTNFGSGYTARGNPTQVQQWVSGSTYLTTQYCYDTTGEVTEKIDPAGNATQYGYTDRFFNDTGSNDSGQGSNYGTNAYLTSITSPIIGTRYSGYYYGSGKLAYVTDENNATTNYHYMDSLDRPTETVHPIGWGLQTYPSSTEEDAYSPVADTSPSTGCTSCQHRQAFLDSWGRETQETLANAPGAAINLAQTYDSNGRVASQSHAYTSGSDPNYVFENYSYDGLDRSAGVTHPDSEYSSISYGSLVAQYGGLSSQQGSTSTYGVGYPELIIDENGKKKQVWLDGFGRLIEVDEAVTAGTTSHGSFSICCNAPISDQGTIYVTVGTFNTQIPYNNSSTVNSIASALASALNYSGLVTATVSSSTVYMTSLITGTAANYSLSSYSEGQLNPPKFRATPSGSMMTGGTNGSANSTFYTYDALGNLTSVVQGTQTPRNFTYDGLGRKTSESTPESGTVSFSFTVSGGGLCSGDPGNPCSKTDARGITTTYAYDQLNRIKSKSYSNGQGSVTYSYDQGGASAFALGRLTQMVDPSGSETYTYDADGDVLQLQKVVGSTTYTLGYQYNAAGELTQVIYPSGRVVGYSYDAIGRLCNVAPSNGSCTASNSYASAYTYDSAGHVTGVTFGNGIVGTYNYFPKTEQLSALSYAKSGSNLFSLNYWYQHDSTNCPGGTTNDDGPIDCITDNMQPGRTVNYTYDALNRLSTAVTNGSTSYSKWGLAESYDQWSNRLSQTVTAGSGPSSSLTFNGQNQPTPSGYGYDASGDMTYDPATLDNYTYDADNRLTAVSGGASASYTYDANGMRVEKSANGTTTVYIYSGSEDIAEYDNGAAPSSPSREFVYGNGELLALVSGGATTYYQKDHLSVRMTTDANGNKLGEEGHYPFGEPWYSTTGNTEWVFTTYQHDQESGLEYAMARYYDPRTAAFCSADPVGGDPSDPESWNRYVYARDNPVILTDPSGQFWDLIANFFENIGEAIGGFLESLFNGKSSSTFTYQFDANGDFHGLVSTTITVTAQDNVSSIPSLFDFLGRTMPIAVPLTDKSLAAFAKAQSRAEKNLQNTKCQQFLQQQGVNPSDLKGAVNNEVPWNGVKSSISEYDAHVTDPQDPVWSTARGIAAAKGTPVSSLFQPQAGFETEAVAQTPGHNVYFRPGGIFGSGGITPINLIHEGLHNLTGLGDASLARKLGLPMGSGSADINPTLKVHHCS